MKSKLRPVVPRGTWAPHRARKTEETREKREERKEQQKRDTPAQGATVPFRVGPSGSIAKLNGSRLVAWSASESPNTDVPVTPDPAECAERLSEVGRRKQELESRH